MATRFKPALKLDLRANPGRVAFNKVEQAEQWIESEIKIWTDYYPGDAKGQGPPYQQTLGEQRRVLHEVKSKVTAAATADGDTVAPTECGLEQALSPFVSNAVLHSDSALGKKALP